MTQQKKRIKNQVDIHPILKEIIKPEKFPEWAKNLVQDEINKEYNRYEPPQAKKDVGWLREEVPPRQWVNYKAWLTCQWLEYLYDRLHKPTRYANAAALPDATASEGVMVYIEDQKILAVSNGTAWQKITTQNL
jgi:hypothetical protein